MGPRPGNPRGSNISGSARGPNISLGGIPRPGIPPPPRPTAFSILRASSSRRLVWRRAVSTSSFLKPIWQRILNCLLPQIMSLLTPPAPRGAPIYRPPFPAPPSSGCSSWAPAWGGPRPPNLRHLPSEPPPWPPTWPPYRHPSGPGPQGVAGSRVTGWRPSCQGQASHLAPRGPDPPCCQGWVCPSNLGGGGVNAGDFQL